MLRSALVAVLLLAAGVLGGVLLERRAAPAAIAADGAATGPVQWTALSPDDRGVTAVFGVAQLLGVRAAIDSLDALASRAPGVRARGHSIAHALGRFAVDRAKGDPSVFAECRESFQSGCYHGVLEGYFAQRPAADSAAIAALCASVVRPDAPALLRRECAHGLGHGLMGRSGGDVAASLAGCEYAGSVDARRECYDGVYMEQAIRVTSGGSSAPATNDGEHGGHAGHTMTAATAPAYSCVGAADRHQASCWSYQPIVALADRAVAVEQVAATCASAGALGAAACDQGLGKQLLGRRMEDPAAVAALCRTLGAARTAACLAGIVEGLLDTDWRGDAARSFCAELRKHERPACDAAIAERAALQRSA